MSADDDGKATSPDWSGRHVRLRFEMLLCAAVFFLLATGNARLNENSIWPIKLTHPDAGGIVLGILAAIYLYLLVAFWLRTRLEQGPVTRFDKESAEAAAKLKSLLDDFRGKVGKFDAEHVVTRLDNWHVSWPKEVLIKDRLAKLGLSLEGVFDKLRISVNRAIEDLSGSKAGKQLLENPRIHLDRLVHDTNLQVGNIEAIIKKMDESNYAMIEANKAAKRQFSEMSDFFGSGILADREELNTATRENLLMLKSLQRGFYISRTVFSWERFGVSVFIPVAASLAMMTYGGWSLLPAWWQWLIVPAPFW